MIETEDKKVCEQCLNCAYYWSNTDTENACEGDKKEPCSDFIQFKGIGH